MRKIIGHVVEGKSSFPVDFLMPSSDVSYLFDALNRR